MLSDTDVQKALELYFEGTSIIQIAEKLNTPIQTVTIALGKGASMSHIRAFTKMNKHWHDNLDYNRMFIQTQQNFANDVLHARGHMFLNEVYDMLGLKRTSAGSLRGWIGDAVIEIKIMQETDLGFLLEIAAPESIFEQIDQL